MTDPPASIISRWQKLKALHQRFCQRWKTEYLHELHKRRKWQAASSNLTVGNMVVVHIFLFLPFFRHEENDQRSCQRSTHRGLSVKSKKFKCRICSRTHPLRQRKQFLAMNPTARTAAVLANRYCKNCLEHKHSQKSCVSDDKCRFCKQSHPYLLHSCILEPEKESSSCRAAAQSWNSSSDSRKLWQCRVYLDRRQMHS